jgi:serine/threonine protein kinase
MRDAVLTERNVLIKLDSQFVTSIIAAFQSEDNLYLLMEYFNGGNLRYHLNRCKHFTEK